ncbi:MAG: LamG-like jellyroll fold domain-containing protein, partial [Planctomycetota bacterium]
VTVNISGDSVVKVEGLWHGQGGPDSNTVINISDNADVYVRDTIYAAGDAGSWFEFSMSGGDVNCGGIEARADGSGRFSITDGNLICRGDMEIRANNGTAEFTLDGGADVNVTGNFGFPADGDGNGVVYLNSGTLICGSFGPDGNDWSLDIDAGVTWLIKGSHAATIQSHIDADRITGKDGAEPPLVVEFLVGEQTWTQVGFDLVQLNAYNPSPTDGNSNICPGGGLTLTWDAGIIVQDTNAHEVFFGKSWADVNSMTDPCAIKNVGDETYDTGPLEYGQSYYWRVDEVNDVNIADPCTWRGPIWHFSTYSGRAREESPPSGRRGLPPGDIDLSWGEFPCQRLTGQTLYYGTDFPQSIVLFDDDFESGAFEPNWTATGSWDIWYPNDPNYNPHDNNLAQALAGTLTSRDIDTGDYANSINVSFVIQLDKGAGTGAVTLNYYNGSTYVPVADWNSLDPCDAWIGYGDTITDSQYLISNFRIQLVSTLSGPNSVYINNVRVTNTWPVDPNWLEAELGPDVNNYPVTIGQFENYAWRLDMNDGNNIIQGAYWTFTTGYGGLLMHYKFDGTPGNPLLSSITDDSGNEIVFTKHDGGGSLTYGVSNPDTIGSTASADFDPNMGLFRLDPCGPSELTRDILRLNGDYTIEMWVMPRNLSNIEEEEKVYLISKRDAWGLAIHNDGCDDDDDEDDCDYQFRGMWKSGGKYDDGVEENEWYHVAIVYTQEDPEEEISIFYINGADEGDGGGLPPADNNKPVWIGANQIADGNLEGHFDGLIDEIRIHDIVIIPCTFLIGPGHPEYPICPVPEDVEQEVDPCGVVLSWTPGESATSHKVYFGTDFVDVNTLESSVVIYEGPNTSVPLDDLENSRTYYWRVVELDGGGPWEGEVWSFTTVYVVVDPNLRVWYTFDESLGDDVYDRSGYGHHAEVDGAGEGWDEGWGPADGKLDGCLKFDNDISVECPDDTLDFITDKISISVWLHGVSRDTGDNWVLQAGEDGADGDYYVGIQIPDDNGHVYFRAGNDTNDVVKWEAGAATVSAWKDWHHLVFIKDEADDKMSIYFDGELKWWKEDTNSCLVNILGEDFEFRVGAETDEESDYEGWMDDLRVYDIALTETQILELFRGDPNVAWAPSPYDGQPDAPYDANLVWKPGDHANSHKVFFGTSWADVNAMTDPCSVQDACEYEPGLLVLGGGGRGGGDEVNDGP